MAAKVNWKIWRDQFVQGPDDLDYKRLSKYTGAPAYSSLRNRASQEDWPDQRKRYRENLGTLAGTVPNVQATVAQAQKIIDAAEMLTRHAGLAKLMGAIAQRELVLIRKKQEADTPTGLKPGDVLSLAKVAIDIERMTEGLATERQEVIDISNLPDAALEKLANGG
jgi:hypothetical protein